MCPAWVAESRPLKFHPTGQLCWSPPVGVSLPLLSHKMEKNNRNQLCLRIWGNDSVSTLKSGSESGPTMAMDAIAPGPGCSPQLQGGGLVSHTTVFTRVPSDGDLSVTRFQKCVDFF